MIDNLISSYRAQIYDWNIPQWKAFLREKWKPLIGSIIFLLLPIGLYLFGAKIKSPVVMLLSLIIEGIPLVYFDRYMVKHHAIALQNRQDRLNKAQQFLRESVPDTNLYQKAIIDELIKRLSERIDQKIPFKNFLKGVGDFAKAIILPVVTYVAGVYSGGLEGITVDIVVAYAVAVIFLLGVLRLTWAGFSAIAQTFFCRDYNAAVAFREDLLDLRLLYFLKDSTISKTDK